MESKLKILENLIVKNFKENHGIQVFFEEGLLLNLYNKWNYSKEIYLLVRRKLINVEETPEKISLVFDDNSILEVDLTESGYLGPEALELVVPGQSPIVWS